MTAPAEVKVYGRDGSTLIATVLRRVGVRWQDELNGIGSGAFALHLDDDILTTSPTLLDPFNIVKCRPLTEADPVMAWQIEELAPAQVSSAEAAGRMVQVSGRHVRSILDTAVVTGDGDQRLFDFSSPDAPLIDADWVAPTGVVNTASTTRGVPVDWQDPLAQYIWSSNPDASAPAGRNWFRGSLILAAETQLRAWVTGDNAFDFRMNGLSLIQSDPTDRYAWRNTYTVDFVLPAGTHIPAAWVDNYASSGGATNPGAFMCTIGTVDADGNLDTVLLRTGNAAWKVHGYANPPGWHAAQILDTLLLEAQADGYLTDITWDFTGLLDSYGEPWTDLQDVAIAVDADLLTVSNMWAGTVFDIEMDPDLMLRAYHRRGSDMSPVTAFTAGVDVLSLAPTVRFGQIRNVTRAQHKQGRVTVTDSGSVTAYGKRATGLSLGDAGTESQASQAATEALIDLASPQITLPLESSSVVGPQPWADFDLGDTISVPDFPTGQTNARVMTITVQEQENHLSYSIDLYPEVTSVLMTDFEPADFELVDFA